jgi:hypothetical protein
VIHALEDCFGRRSRVKHKQTAFSWKTRAGFRRASEIRLWKIRLPLCAFFSRDKPRGKAMTAPFQKIFLSWSGGFAAGLITVAGGSAGGR